MAEDKLKTKLVSIENQLGGSEEVPPCTNDKLGWHLDYIEELIEEGGGGGGDSSWGHITGNIQNQTDLQTEFSKKANLVSGKVPASELPSYVDDVLEYADVNSFPSTGEQGKIYVALDTGFTYRWSGSEYIQIGGQDLSNYVDLTSNQIISGDKNFTGTLQKNGVDVATTATVPTNLENGTGTGSLKQSSCTATGNYAFAEGSATTASGWYSHAEGYATAASASYSHAEGYGTKAKAESQTVVGKYNADNNNALFIVGNGTSNDRSNAFEVHSDGNVAISKFNGKEVPTYPANADWKGVWYGTLAEFNALDTTDANVEYHIMES